MNINYHYHVIKTLALKAEFASETAEMIAFYSQMVDDLGSIPFHTNTYDYAINEAE